MFSSGGKIMKSDEAMMMITLKGGQKLHVDPQFVQQICGQTILRLVGTQEELAQTGAYQRPFFVYNREQGVYHAYPSPFDALRATVHARGRGGTFADDYSEGEKQKLLAWMEQHKMLRLWLSEEGLAEAERERVNQQCERLAIEMGRPIDTIKCDILAYTLEVANMEEESEAVQLLAEVLNLDAQRIGNVEKIGDSLNWRGAMIAREIGLQQQAERDAAQLFHGALETHVLLQGTFEGREQLFDQVRAIEEHLVLAVDRPYIGLARNDSEDIDSYCEALLRGTFAEAEGFLRSAVAAHEQFHIARDLNAVLYRLAAARHAQKNSKSAMRMKAVATLMRVRGRLNPAAAPTKRQRRMLWSVHGRVNDAIFMAQAESVDWNDVRDSVRSAVMVLGG